MAMLQSWTPHETTEVGLSAVSMPPERTPWRERSLRRATPSAKCNDRRVRSRYTCHSSWRPKYAGLSKGNGVELVDDEAVGHGAQVVEFGEHVDLIRAVDDVDTDPELHGG